MAEILNPTNFFLELFPAVHYISCGAACFAAPQEDAAPIGASETTTFLKIFIFIQYNNIRIFMVAEITMENFLKRLSL